MTMQDDYHASRRAHIEEQQRNRQARRRRETIVAISSVTAAVLVVAGLVGFGVYKFSTMKDSGSTSAAPRTEPSARGSGDASGQGSGDAGAPIAGEKDWDTKKLTRNHVTTPVRYPMTPPVGGDHAAVWMNCGGVVYQKPVPDVNAVHSLEHGAVWVTYTDKASAADVKKLGGKVSVTPYSLMSPYQDQAGAIMLSAWGKQLTVDSADDPRVNQFFTRYVEGPQTPEPGAPCTGGLDER